MLTLKITKDNKDITNILYEGRWNIVSDDSLINSVVIAAPNYKNLKDPSYKHTVNLPIKLIVTKTIIFKIL